MPMIFTKSSVKPELIAANKDYMGRNSWDMAFGQIGRQSQLAEQQLSNEYDNAMIQAYMSSSAAENAIRSSNLGQGYKDAALSDNQRSLQDAFESYRTNYLAGKNEIDTSRAESIAQVNKAIDSQAANVSKYANYMFEYLPYLYEQQQELFATDPALKRFVKQNEDGSVSNLLSTDELQGMLFDKDGSLNAQGIDFMNMIQNYGSSGKFGTDTFSNFLYEKDSALSEWLSSDDPYSAGKTNLDTFNEILGGNSNQYILDRNSFTDKQFADLQSDYTRAHDSLVSEYEKGHKSEKDAKAFMSKQGEATQSLVRLAEDLGVADNEEIKELISKVTKNIETYNSTIESPGKGNNRSNREWATSNALADYEELYDAVMNAYRSTGFENTTNRSNYRAVERAMDSYESGQMSLDEYNDVLSRNVTLKLDDDVAGSQKIRSTIAGAGSNAPTSTGSTVIYYNIGDNKESIELAWDNDKPIKSEFVSINSYSRDASESGFDKSGDFKTNKFGKKNLELGVLPDGSPAVRIDGKVYKASYSNTKHNKTFVDYLKTFK